MFISLFGKGYEAMKRQRPVEAQPVVAQPVVAASLPTKSGRRFRASCVKTNSAPTPSG